MGTGFVKDWGMEFFEGNLAMEWGNEVLNLGWGYNEARWN